MITLTYNQPIRSASWLSAVTTFSVEGYSRVQIAENAASKFPHYVESTEEADARSIQRRHELASSIYTGAVILANGEGKDIYYANKAAQFEAAEVLATGDHVLIEGREYVVSFPQNGEFHNYPRLADPIKFNPV